MERRPACPGDSHHAAATPPIAPQAWPCQEMPVCGTRLESSAPPQTTPTTTAVRISSRLRLNTPRVNR